MLSVSLVTADGELSGEESGIRSPVTWTLPPFASQGTDESPVKFTLAAPVYPFSSPMTATAPPRRELSSAAEIAVVPTSPEVDTREPVRSA